MGRSRSYLIHAHSSGGIHEKDRCCLPFSRSLSAPCLIASAQNIDETHVNSPASDLDMKKWMDEFTDTEYQSCSKGHYGAGMNILPNGKRSSVNVESVGGHLAVQHYTGEIYERNHLKFVSEKSDAWIFHLIHFRPKVTWEMKLIPKSEVTCVFQNHVAIEHANIVIKIASAICLFPYFVKSHNHEETRLFAESLLKHKPNQSA